MTEDLHVMHTNDDMLQLAKLHHRAGKLELAESSYRKILSEEPDNAEATHLLGLIALQVGKLPLSEQLFQTAIELNDQDPVIYCNLATCYVFQQRTDEAKELLRQALDLDENYGDAYANLGKVLFQENELEQAKKQLIKAVNNGVNDGDTVTTLAKTHYLLGNLDKAIHLLQKLIQKRPDQATLSTYNVLVEALKENHKVLEAISWAEKLRQRQPHDPHNEEQLEELYKMADISRFDH